MAKHIKILHGDPATGRLILDKPDLVAVTHNKIKWKIVSGSGVDSIVDIIDKSGYRDVWLTRPKNNNSWEGKIKSKHSMPTPYEYKYSIRWKVGDNIPPDHDPKITINPALIELPDDSEPIFKEKALIPLVVSVLVVTAVALVFWSKKKNKKHWH